MGTLVLGGVFERHPKLRIVCVEADAGWVPHYMYRMDHAYKRHRNWLPPGQALSKLPSEYFAENIYTTFQDDWVAFKTADLMNWRRLMWANDFPHSDSTWPWSQEMLAEHTTDLTRGAAARDPLRQRGGAVRDRRRGAGVGNSCKARSGAPRPLDFHLLARAERVAQQLDEARVGAVLLEHLDRGDVDVVVGIRFRFLFQFFGEEFELLIRDLADEGSGLLVA